MCWMNGGIREEGGCSGPSWLMTCCVPQVTRNDQLGPATAALRSSPGSGPFLLANTLGDSIANLGRDDCEFFPTRLLPPIFCSIFKNNTVIIIIIIINLLHVEKQKKKENKITPKLRELL